MQKLYFQCHFTNNITSITNRPHLQISKYIYFSASLIIQKARSLSQLFYPYSNTCLYWYMCVCVGTKGTSFIHTIEPSGDLSKSVVQAFQYASDSVIINTSGHYNPFFYWCGFASPMPVATKLEYYHRYRFSQFHNSRLTAMTIMM